MRTVFMRLGLSVAFTLSVVRAASGAAQSRDDHISLLVTLAGEALRQPRLAAPMPCLAHWLAGNDHVVLAVSLTGQAAGLAPGDTLQRIGVRRLTGRAEGVWDAALRALPAGTQGYTVEVSRAARNIPLTLPCSPTDAKAFHEAERSMWTAITRRDWAACAAAGAAMIDAFGSDISPPLMIMNQCAAAQAGAPQAASTYRLARALLGEMTAHPDPPIEVRADMREQLFLALRDLERLEPGAAGDYAAKLRDQMRSRGVTPP
jgi:hypothetical protein